MSYASLFGQLFDQKSALAIAVIFIPLERLLPLRRSQAILRKGWKTDLIYLLLNSALMNIAIVLGIATILSLKAKIIWSVIPEPVAHQPLWLQVIELILVADLAHYWMHRMFHSPMLWSFHALHHSTEELDWLATFRVHPVDHVPTSIVMLLPVMAFGWSPWAVGVWGSIYRGHAILQHANIRLPLGRFGLAVVGPEFHRWHHSTAGEARNKNFAAQFALWDVLFGTHYLPQGVCSDSYGIEETIPTKYVDQLCHPFRELRQKWRN